MNAYKIRKELISAYFVVILVTVGFAGLLVFEGVVDDDGGAAASSIIIVDKSGGGNYTTIQTAINAANAGDTIRVWAGTYNEKIVINKRLTLIGNGTTNTTINGGGSGEVVKITVNGVKIYGFKIINSGSTVWDAGIKLYYVSNCRIINNNCSKNENGIYLRNSNSNIIENNTCISNNWDGIFLINSNRNIFENNTCLNNKYGIDLSKSSKNTFKNNTCSKNGNGIQLSQSYKNKIVNNNYNYNSARGIVLQSPSNENMIINNNCSNCSDGIEIYSSINNIIINNTCLNNVYGIQIDDSNKNTIENNTCSNNWFGITLYSSPDNILKNNTITITGTQIGFNFNNVVSYNNTITETNTVNGVPMRWYTNIIGNVSQYIVLQDINVELSKITNIAQIMLYNCHYVKLKNSTTKNGTNNGFLLYSSNNNIVENNTCYSNNENGIKLTFSSNNNLTNNNCSKNDKGISLSQSNWSNIDKNNGSTNRIGIQLDSSSSNIVKNNTCNSNDNHGIFFKSSSNNKLKNNTCNSNDNGIYLKLSSKNELKNNSCSNNVEGILFENSDMNILLNNICVNNSVGINFTSNSDYCCILNSSINGSTISKIRLEGNSHAFALNCSINWSCVNFADTKSDLTVQWFMRVNVTNITNDAVQGAEVIVKDNSSKLIFSGNTDKFGWLKWIICSEYTKNKTGNISIHTPHNVSVDHDLYERSFAEPEPNMNISKTVKIILEKDITPPNPPSSVVLIVKGGHYLNFSWTPSDSYDVKGYNIYINDTNSNSSFHFFDFSLLNYYNITNLNENTIYFFQIKAYDGVPWESVPLSYNNTTLDIPPKPPTNLTFTTIGSTFINFSWAASNSSDVLGYNIYINDTDTVNSFHLLDLTTNTYYNATDLDDEITYYFKINAFDIVPWESTALSGNTTTIDVTPPNPPTELIFNVIGSTYINFSWNASISFDLLGYNIYINKTGSSSSFNYLNTTTDTYYNTTGLAEEKTYYFEIRAFDEVPWESSPLSGNNTTLDVTSPKAPTNLIISTVGSYFINVTWTASISLDVQGYEIYINDTGSTINYHLLGNSVHTYYYYSGFDDDTTYYFKVRAFDEVPLFSGFSNIVSSTTVDITPPAKPKSLRCSKVGGTFIYLSWSPSVSLDVTGYEIYVNDTSSTTNFHYLDTTVNINYNHTGLIEEITYYYMVRAMDEVPWFSIYSNVVSTTTLDITPSTPPTGFVVNNISSHKVTFSWDANTEADLSGYHVYQGSVYSGPFHRIHTITGTTTHYTVLGLAEESTYYFAVTAFDEVPNESLYSNVITAKTLDVTAPQPPKGLEAYSDSGTEISLYWKSNIETDVAGYHIYMNDSGSRPSGEFHIIDIVGNQDTYYIVTDLTEQVTYYFKLVAFDEVPNNSSFSNVASATTLDMSWPRVPTGLTVTNRTHNTITLTWDPNPEADVVGYYLYRSFSSAGRFIQRNKEPIAETQYIDTNLNEVTTYYYKLKAIDDVEHESGFSEPVFGKTILRPYPPEINRILDVIKIAEDTYDDHSISLYHIFKDKNKDPLTFWCKGQKHINVTIHQDTGMVVLRPEKDWNGEEVITFYASDGIAAKNAEILAIIVVTTVNDLPGPVEIITPENNIELEHGTLLNFQANCTDPDLPYGDVLTYTWSSDIIGEMEGKTLNDILLPVGKHIITVEVTDQEGASSEASIEIDVLKSDNPDFDNDGMPNDWELEYGLNPIDPTDAKIDSDKDGLSNLEEYQKETDPNQKDTDKDGHDDKEDAYPNNPAKWEKETPTRGGKKDDDSNWVWILVVVVIIIIFLILFLFVIKPKMSKKGKPEETAEEKPKMQLPPGGTKTEPLTQKPATPAPYLTYHPQIPTHRPQQQFQPWGTYPQNQPQLPPTHSKIRGLGSQFRGHNSQNSPNSHTPKPTHSKIRGQGSQFGGQGPSTPQTPSPTHTSTDIKSLAIKGSFAYSQGRYEDAIITWQEILEREPGKHQDIEKSIKDVMGKMK